MVGIRGYSYFYQNQFEIDEEKFVINYLFYKIIDTSKEKIG